jgi:hypothetical protein
VSFSVCTDGDHEGTPSFHVRRLLLRHLHQECFMEAMTVGDSYPLAEFIP